MKGNMFLGYARGSVGDVTFSRTNGQQQARARNRNPNNPRTSGQMMQRSLFANSVKFHTRGVQQLFKFAFEDKKSNESDYNAFMKHNMANGVRISKQASQSPLYPAFGYWQMSCGSLKKAVISLPTDENTWQLTSPSATSNMNKYGQLSAVLKADYNLQEGDIVTLVHITAFGAMSSNLPAIEAPSELQGSNWDIQQFEINTTSEVALPSYIACDNGKVMLSYEDSSTTMYAQGFAMIFSRKTAAGLKVSNSYLVNNEVAEAIIAKAKAPEFEELVLQSWDTSAEAILEGSLIP